MVNLTPEAGCSILGQSNSQIKRSSTLSKMSRGTNPVKCSKVKVRNYQVNHDMTIQLKRCMLCLKFRLMLY